MRMDLMTSKFDSKAFGAALPGPPTWDRSDRHFAGHLVRALIDEMSGLVLRYGWYRGNKVAYLRHLGVGIGKDCDILNSVKNFGTEPWLIEIGQRVTIAEGVLLYTHDGASRVFRDCLPNSSPWGNHFGTIRILDNCFIGANSIIMPDVEIGPDSIVGAGSVVTHDVPPQMVVAGVPAEILCSLDEYRERYQLKKIPIKAANRRELRRELTHRFWGKVR